MNRYGWQGAAPTPPRRSHRLFWVLLGIGAVGIALFILSFAATGFMAGRAAVAPVTPAPAVEATAVPSASATVAPTVAARTPRPKRQPVPTPDGQDGGG